MRKPRGGRSTKPAKPAAKLGAIAIGGLLAWQTLIVSIPLARQVQFNEMIADFASYSRAAATAAAEQRLEANDPAGAALLAKRAIEISPISAEPVRIFALAKQQQGDLQTTGAVLGQAAALGWRDLPTQIWLASAYANMKDYNGAANRIDAALRANPSASALHNLVDASLTDPALAHAIAQRLTSDTQQWRKPYLLYSAAGSTEAAMARRALLLDLAHSGAPPSRDEIAHEVSQLLRFDKIEEAHSLWLGDGHSGNQLYDPDFAEAKSGGTLPFEWTTHSTGGATTDVERSGNISALRVQTDGRTAGRVAEQVLVLKPGPHRISFSADAGAAAGGFVWRIGCRPGSQMIFELKRSSAGKNAAAFDVPAAGCRTQVMALDLLPLPKPQDVVARFWKVTVV